MVAAGVISLVNPAGLAKSVIYQPLHRDDVVSPAQWQLLFNTLQQHGFSGLIVQWARYGDSDFLQPASPLQQALAAAISTDMQIWLGLYADPTAFSAEAASNRQLTISAQLAKSALLLSQLEAALPIPAARLAGWYLPLELYDTDLQSDIQISWLKHQLAAFISEADKPVAISVFSNGQLEPAVFAQRLALLHQPGLTVWLQDGAGAGLLSSTARQQLLQRLDCRSGVIAEAFRQPQYQQAFSAEAASENTLKQSVADIKPCHPLAYFSLRYLPIAQSVLPLQDPTKP